MSEQNDVDYISGAIAQAQVKIEELQAAIRTLESLRALVGGTAPPTAATGGKVSFGHDAFFGMTAGDAARKYLTAIKKTATAKTIADALVDGGWKSSSKNVPENVRTMLTRNPQFVVINGEFGLADWYPGRRANRRVSTNPKTFVEGEDGPDVDAQYEAMAEERSLSQAEEE